MQKMKMPIIVSIIVMALVTSVVGVGALAIFNDTETLGSNVFAAGTLDLEFNSVAVPITLGNMKPGDGEGGAEHTTITYQYTIRNVGTLDGIVTMKIINVKNYENGRNEPELLVDGTGGNPGLGNGELGQYLNLQINMPGPAGFYYGLQGCGHSGCLGGRQHSINCWEDHVITVGTLPAGTTWTPSVLEFVLPSSVGNVIQSDSVVFDVLFELVQA